MTTEKTRGGSRAVTRQTLGTRATTGPSTWVQTDRAAHEAWGRLTIANPRAAGLLHTLVARMGERNAVVVSRSTLAALMGCSEATIKRAVADLKAGNWIEVVQLGGKGGVNAYLVNSAVAWGQPRDQLHLAHFSATVVANAAEQDADVLEHRQLRRIPVLYPGEQQLPTGEGEGSTSESAASGELPDLPALAQAAQANSPTAVSS